MSITDGGYTLAEVQLQSVHGVRGIGINRLQFVLAFQINASRAGGAALTAPACFIWAGRTQAEMKPLGVATVETSWYVETLEHARRESLSAYLDLSSEQLEALERLRQGGSFYFRLDFRALIHSRERGVQRGDHQSWLEATLSSWSKVLEDLGYAETLLIALDLPTRDVPAALAGAMEQLREAHRDLVAGRFDGTVGRVRLAMEAIDAVLGFSAREQVIGEFRATPRNMSKRARTDLVRIAVRHYTHLAHHMNESGMAQSFSRHDAQFALAAASAAMWDAMTQAVANGKNPTVPPP